MKEFEITIIEPITPFQLQELIERLEEGGTHVESITYATIKASH